MVRARTIDEFRHDLAPGQLETVDRLRAIAAASGTHLVERIKWNAPSFAQGETDRITLGLEKDGGIRVVLHRGATAVTPPGFAFAAPADLVQWAAPDRGILRFSSAAAVDNRADEIGDVFRRWLEIN
jgi:hypothetical protein